MKINMKCEENSVGQPKEFKEWTLSFNEKDNFDIWGLDY